MSRRCNLAAHTPTTGPAVAIAPSASIGRARHDAPRLGMLGVALLALLPLLLCLPLLGQPPAGVPAAAPAGRPRTPAPPATPLALTVDIPQRGLTVGDQVEAVLSLRLPRTAALAGEPRFPSWGETWGDAEILRRDEPRRTAGADGGATYTQRLLLAAFRPGRIELPPATVAVPLRGATVPAATPSGLALTIRSVLPGQPPQPGQPPPDIAAAKKLEPKPPAPLAPLPIGAPFWWTLSALAATAAAAGWLLWRRHRAALAAAAAVPVPLLEPLPELLAALDQLDGEPSSLALHTRLSLALRRYLGRVLSFAAPESTNSEIQRLLVARGVPAALVRPAIELLRACDLVKFARHEVEEARGRERLDAARRLARLWDAELQPAPAAAAGGAGTPRRLPPLEAAS
ncbi:MAG TPA: hypothetical protein VHR45_20515 [Thermoanaerobaculia bacterium]|nr:hypothetical protein [Thermoanaerobaculia bacterium]